MLNSTNLSSQNRLRECYLTLGLAPQTQWPEIKRTYRRLVQKNHPDRFNEGTPEHKQALNNFLALQQAYEYLSAHNQTLAETQTPKLQSPSSNKKMQFQQPPFSTTSKSTINKSTQYRDRIRANSFSKRWLLIGLGLLPIGYAFRNELMITNKHNQELTNVKQHFLTTKISDSSSPQYQAIPDYASFSIGDDMQTVLSSQGQPTRIEGNNWFYGASKVIFAKGKVIDWQNTTSDPLKTR